MLIYFITKFPSSSPFYLVTLSSSLYINQMSEVTHCFHRKSSLPLSVYLKGYEAGRGDCQCVYTHVIVYIYTPYMSIYTNVCKTMCAQLQHLAFCEVLTFALSQLCWLRVLSKTYKTPWRTYVLKQSLCSLFSSFFRSGFKSDYLGLWIGSPASCKNFSWLKESSLKMKLALKTMLCHCSSSFSFTTLPTNELMMV